MIAISKMQLAKRILLGTVFALTSPTLARFAWMTKEQGVLTKNIAITTREGVCRMKLEELSTYIQQTRPNVCQINVLQNGREAWSGEWMKNPDSYALDIPKMNETDTHTLNLTAGDVLQIEFETEKGSLHMGDC